MLISFPGSASGTDPSLLQHLRHFNMVSRTIHAQSPDRAGQGSWHRHRQIPLVRRGLHHPHISHHTGLYRRTDFSRPGCSNGSWHPGHLCINRHHHHQCFATKNASCSAGNFTNVEVFAQVDAQPQALRLGDSSHLLRRLRCCGFSGNGPDQGVCQIMTIFRMDNTRKTA